MALLQGSRLPQPQREHIARQVARFSGLSAEFVLRCDLRPNEWRFFKELLRDRGRTVGRLDTRFLGLDRDDAGEKPDDDPAMSNLIGAYAAGINRLLKDKLKFDSDSPYVVHAPLWEKWAWKDFANKYVNVGESLRRAMHANPHMRVYVASGYYDLGTPHAAGDYTVNHLGLREPLRENVAVSYFEAGHMMYIHWPSLARMSKELKAFVTVAERLEEWDASDARGGIFVTLRAGTIFGRGAAFRSGTSCRATGTVDRLRWRSPRSPHALAQGTDDQWEISSRMEMPGMAISVPAQVVKICVGKNPRTTISSRSRTTASCGEQARGQQIHVQDGVWRQRPVHDGGRCRLRHRRLRRQDANDDDEDERDDADDVLGPARRQLHRARQIASVSLHSAIITRLRPASFDA